MSEPEPDAHPDHPDHQEAPSDTALRVQALESLLVEKGLVVRGSDKRDGRRVVVNLTARGTSLRGVLVPVAVEFIAEATKGLEGKEIEEAMNVLKVISTNISEMES